jgi:hypothetical protein
VALVVLAPAVQAVRVLAVQVALAPDSVHVLAVLVLVHLAQAALVVVLAPAVVLVVLVALEMVSVARLARSHVHVVGASSMNCSRSSLSTRIAMRQFLREQSLLSVVGQHRSLLQN